MKRQARRLVLVCLLAGAAMAQADDRRSGLSDMTPATQALQRDDNLNPALLWVAGGQAAWATRSGRADKACADCHGALAQAMRGVAPRYPAFDDARAGPLTLADRINACRVRHQHRPRKAIGKATASGDNQSACGKMAIATVKIAQPYGRASSSL